MILSIAFCFGVSFLLERWSSVPAAQYEGIQFGERGLILSNTLNRNETAVVLLEGMANPHGPRVIVNMNQPLTFQQSSNAALTLPSVPFGDDTPLFMKSLAADIRFGSEMFSRRYSEGFISYLSYTGSLIFLLCSLGFAVKFSIWPLANLFIGALAFRGVLTLCNFFNTQDVQGITGFFLDNLIPVSFALPLAFLVFGFLINIYSLLVFASRRRHDNDH